MGELIALLSLVLFSTNVIITKAASSRVNLNIGFLIQITMNVLFAGILLLGQFIVNGFFTEFHWFAFWMFVISGVLTSYLGRFLYFDSIVKLGPSKASAVMVSNPLFTAIISLIFLGEMLEIYEVGAGLIVLSGLFLLSYVPSAKDGEKKERRTWRELFTPGIFMALLGSVCYALGNITRGAGVQDWNEPILGGFLGAAVAVLLQLIFNKEVRNLIPTLRTADRKGVWMYAVTGAFTIGAQIGQIAAMHYIPISIVTLITMSQSLIVIPLSYFLLKNQEKITLRTIGGSLLVLSGISIILLY